MPLKVERPVPPFIRLVFQEWDKTSPIERNTRGSCHTAKLKQGGRDVDVRRDAVDPQSRLERTGPAYKKRHSRTAFVNTAFSTAHPAVVSTLLRSVVGHEDHNRVFGKPHFFEFPEEP